MRTTRNKKRTVSLILAAVLLMTVFATAKGSAATGSISYGYTQSQRGYAQGTITLNAPAGTYWLYWADNDKALEGFYSIAKLTLSSSGSKTHTMPAQTAIPADATKVIAIAGTSEPSNKNVSNAAAVYDIPLTRRLSHTSDQRRYRFGSYSDVHFDAMYRNYKYDETHWSHALQAYADRNVDFLVGSGDYADNNVDYPNVWENEWPRYQKILAESDYCNPVYEAIGNHELWHGVSEGTTRFIKQTGLEGNTSSANHAYYEKTINGDHFIFMALEGGFNPKEVSEFTDAQLNWVEGLLNRYSGDGHNIYIIEHALFKNWGAGDNPNSNYYDIPLYNYDSTNRLKSILQAHKDVIFISGHTHIAFNEQYNFSDANGSAAQMIHNSSVGGVRHVQNGSLTHNYAEDEAEGYIVDVFDDAILFYGANLYYNRVDPNCSYIVKTSQQIAGGPVPTQSTTVQPVTNPPVTVAPTTAAPTTVQPTTAQPATVQPTTAPFTGTPSSYYLKGSFNSWGTSNRFYTTQESGVISTTVNLSRGTYEFKINIGNTWYGNNGTIQDTTKKTSQGGWIMSTDAGNCTLNASGGTYTFNYIMSSQKLTVLYSGAATYGKKPAAEAVGSNKTYYLFGYIEGRDYGCNADYQSMGSYRFNNGTLTATFNQDSYVAVKEANNAAWYMTDGYKGEVRSATLYNTNVLGDNANKIKIPAGTTANFTLTENSNGTLTLSYTTPQPTTAPQPATAAPTVAPTAAPTVAPTVPPTNPVSVTAYAKGDVNGDSRIDVRDVTLVQRFVAQIESLSAAQQAAAEVTGDGSVTIADAGDIQKYIAQIISSFASQQPTQPTTDGVSDSEKITLLNTVSGNLSRFYRYASYDNYMALKKEYRADLALKNSGNLAQMNTAKLRSLQTALLGIVDQSNVDSTGTTRKVYFQNNKSWSQIKAYVWGNGGTGSMSAWPGNDMTLEGYDKTYGWAVYSITVTNSNFKNVIFTDGNGKQTQDLRIYLNDNVVYYTSDDNSSGYYCKAYMLDRNNLRLP